MRNPMRQLSALTAALVLAGVCGGQTTVSLVNASTPSTATTEATTLPPGQARVANRVAGPFATLAGSRENAVALATALRNGTTATLTYSSSDNATITASITPPTKPMGWGNVSHALALAQHSLTQAGVVNPTGADLQAALAGGTIVTADGKTVALSGVLQQRASGMGWGRIAQSYGTTMGAVNRGIKAPSMPAIATTPPTQPVSVPRTGGLEPREGASSITVTAAGRSGVIGSESRGLTTAGGAANASGHGSKGLTTASGAVAGSGSAGVVTGDGGGRGHGHGNTHGRGIVTASGGSVGAVSADVTRGGASAGTVTGTGAAASSVTSAQPSHGSGNGNAHGKGKGGG